MASDHGGAIPMVALGAGGPVVSRIGLGLAALGRPAYITSGREDDLPDRSAAGLRARTFSILDAAYAAGVSHVDAAHSYGRAEEFLGDWRLDVEQQEVKEHSLAMFTAQLARAGPCSASTSPCTKCIR